MFRDGDSEMSPIVDVTLKDGQSNTVLTRTNKLWIMYSYEGGTTNAPGFALKLDYKNYGKLY